MSNVFEPRTAVVTIYGGDYLDRIRFLERRADAEREAEDAQLPRLASEEPAYLVTAREHDELVAEAEASAVHVKVQALPRKVWKALVAAHPPREAGDDVAEKDADADAANGVNTDAFRDALVYGGSVKVDGKDVEYRSIIEPADLTAEQIDELADIDFDRIYLNAFALNRVVGPDPKASLVSRLTPTNSETSS